MANTQAAEYKNRSTLSTRKMVLTAMMSAIATVIYYLDFPVPLMPGFIKLDFSNVIALLAGFSMGPVSGITVCLIKNIIQLVMKGFGTTMGIGNIFDFVTSAAFACTAGLLYKHNRTKKGAMIASGIGAAVFTLISLPLNYFIVYPIYFKAYGGEAAILGAYQAILPSVKNTISALVIFNLPFTFIKAALCVVITAVIYKPLSPVIKGKN